MIKNKVYLNRTFPCSATKLFEWLHRSELLIQWFGPPQMEKVKVKLDARDGGHFEFTFKKPNGNIFIIEGQFIKITAPSSIEFSMSYRGLALSKSVVKIELTSASESRCELRLVQDFETTPKSMNQRTNAWFAMINLLFSKLSQHPIK